METLKIDMPLPVYSCAQRNKSLLVVVIFFLLTTILIDSSFCDEKKWDIEDLMSQEITVDLREPKIEDGVLSTVSGGIIMTDQIRIQAQILTYRKTENSTTVEAEGNLMVEYGPYVFVGCSLFYDFDTKTGYVCNGRTGLAPWYMGGEKIHLLEDGSYLIEDAYVTTSENYKAEWSITSEEARIRDYRFLHANNVKFKFLNLPVFWLPSFRIKMDSVFDSPLRYTVRVGGQKGPRVGVAYELYASDTWKSFARIDYRLERGFGGGIEVMYDSPDRRQTFRSINYFANDISLSEPSKRQRYRIQGTYSGVTCDDRTSMYLAYDKLSDRDMATDYHDRGLELDAAKRTQFHVRHQETNWITNFLTRLRINSFQTVKQELPTLSGGIRPLNLGKTGIITEGKYKLSYLDFEYDKFDSDVPDYNSTRVEFNSKIYRPFCIGPINATPEAEGIAIFYGNNPGQSSQWLTAGIFRYEINSDLYRCFGDRKHVFIPYVNLEYITFPSLTPDEHHIFDIEDGWFEQKMITVGTRNHLLTKDCNGCVNQILYADLYTHAFVDTDTIPELIPKIYANIRYFSTPRMRHTIDTAWDFNNEVLDHINFGTDVTMSEDAALSFEYRHRSKYDWRKADHTNFILDSFRSIEELEDSTISDRRDTLLFHLYYRVHPEWIFEFQSRHGWNRDNEPNYDEYVFNLNGDLRSAWHVRFSYRHKENEDRFSFNISIGIKKPCLDAGCPIPCLDF